MLFKIENKFKNGLIISLLIHTSMFVLAAGTEGISFSGKETQIEMIPASELGIGDDLTIGGAAPKIAASIVLKSYISEKYTQSNSGLPSLDDNNVAHGNDQEIGNDNLEGDGYGHGGSGDTNSGSMISGSLPMYPARARESGLEGSLILRVRIEPDGSISDVTLRVSSGYAPFDEAAERAVKKWRFRPVIRNGAAVSKIHDIRVKFKLNSFK
jgi:TonB family protein